MIEVCSCCNKKFIITGLKKDYKYKFEKYPNVKRQYFCSYNCKRAKEKELEQEMEM